MNLSNCQRAPSAPVQHVPVQSEALSHLSSVGTTAQTCAQQPQRQKDWGHHISTLATTHLIYLVVLQNLRREWAFWLVYWWWNAGQEIIKCDGMGPYLIDEGYVCLLLLLLLFQMVWMVMTMGQKNDSFAPFAACLEKKENAQHWYCQYCYHVDIHGFSIDDRWHPMFLSASHSWRRIAYIGALVLDVQQPMIHFLQYAIGYCRMLQKSNRAKMLWVLVVRSNWPPKVYTGTGHVQYYHALPISAGIQDSVSANSNNLIASCEFEQFNLQAKKQETTHGHFPI